jgi:hypothetical protein
LGELMMPTSDQPKNAGDAMDIKRTLMLMLANALALAMVASPASAATPQADIIGTATATFSSPESSLSLADGTTISCTSGTGTGESTSSTTGTATYLLHGCRELATVFRFSCASEGKPAGTIAIAPVVTHSVYLDELHTKPGVLATPPASGVFAKFTCAGFATVEVKGTGILGEVTSPKCGATSKTGTGITATKSHGVQALQKVEETGTAYNLTASLNGGAFQSAATTWSVTGTANQNITLTCPEQF